MLHQHHQSRRSALLLAVSLLLVTGCLQQIARSLFISAFLPRQEHRSILGVPFQRRASISTLPRWNRPLDYVTSDVCRPSYYLKLLSSSPRPIDGNAWPYKFPAKEHCSKCGLCETTFVSRVADACPFLHEGMGRLNQLEVTVHGRGRGKQQQKGNENNNFITPVPEMAAEESRFGVQYVPMQFVKAIGIKGAQWTGCVTSIAVAMLESGMVDAVVCIAESNATTSTNQNYSSSWCSPEPIVAKSVSDVLRGRGVKPALAPSLRVLDQIKQDQSIRKLLFCGVGCSVQAFRAIQDDLHLDEVYVLGTNCADNSPTPQAAKNFLDQLGLNVNATSVKGYEFMPDFRVHVKTKMSLPPQKDNGGDLTDNSDYITKPYFCLPGSLAKASIAPSCLACFDYTNALADVVVGYMAAPYQPGIPMTNSYQTITIRNARGAAMVQAAKTRLQRSDIPQTGTQPHESLVIATLQSDALVKEMIGGSVRNQGMPLWLGEIMSGFLSTWGPKGISFARYSIDYHNLRNYLHVLSEWGEERAKQAQLPQFARDSVQYYQSKYPSFQQLIKSVISTTRPS